MSEEIAQAKRNKEDASAKIDAMRAVGDEIKDLEARLKEIEAALEDELLQVPNLPEPIGAGGRRGRLRGAAHLGHAPAVRLPAQGPPGPGRRRST